LNVGDGSWFDWDAANEGHVLDHGVDPAEVEEAMLDPNRLKDDARNVAGERREALIGAREDGCVLHVVYTRRGEEGGKMRPITARAADGTEKRRYRRGRR
jgi:uncharacterized DUF497 family protein